MQLFHRIRLYILGIALMTLGGYAQGTVVLGAHPLWAQQTAFGGIALGTVLFVLGYGGVRLKSRAVATIALVALTGSFAVAFWGKQVYAASYAENDFAGKCWYFGWFAITTSATMLLLGIISLFAAKAAPQRR